jgi:hypothetical protein
VHTQLVEDALGVPASGGHADAQVLGDLFHLSASGHEPQHLSLALGQLGGSMPIPFVMQRLESVRHAQLVGLPDHATRKLLHPVLSTQGVEEVKGDSIPVPLYRPH